MEFREMRRKCQQLSEEESIGILQKATIEHLTGKEAIELVRARKMKS